MLLCYRYVLSYVIFGWLYKLSLVKVRQSNIIYRLVKNLSTITKPLYTPVMKKSHAKLRFDLAHKRA